MIELKKVTKSYGNLVAINNITLTIPSNSITALLGLNGAGKTTLLKAIASIHYVDSGSIFVNNIDAEMSAIKNKQQIGIVSEQDIFYADFTTYDFLYYTTGIAHPTIRKRERYKKISDVITLCSLQEVLEKPIKTLSTGYKQRLSFAHALLHDPKVLLLDEPTSGLDPQQIVEMRNLIIKLSKHITILISTHLMQEAESLCSQIAIIHKGELIAFGSEKELCSLSKTQCLESAFLHLIQSEKEGLIAKQ